jgi:hypothetical protein
MITGILLFWVGIESHFYYKERLEQCDLLHCQYIRYNRRKDLFPFIFCTIGLLITAYNIL